MTAIASPIGVSILGTIGPRYEEILTVDALIFLADLHRTFETERKRLMRLRDERQRRFDMGELPIFLHETYDVRHSDWVIAPIPDDLLDRRVEITGPVDRKTIINALNSGAKVFMGDFEDANAPSWANNIKGQINLKDRWSDQLTLVDSARGKSYRLNEKTAVLTVRPRGWHLPEAHLVVDGEPIAGALFDFGLYLFHNHKPIAAHGTGPYFYLPKLESHLEARLWNSIFLHAQSRLGLKVGTIKATVLIETLPAAFEMDEILYEMREHIVGLNCGRWDYIFSFIKKFSKNPAYLMPDRGQVEMGKDFLGAYANLLVKTCHRRGAFAMGGMAAQIPIKNDPALNERAFATVKADKEREVREGHDGTWVAHPDLVPIAAEVFNRLMPGPNQLGNQRAEIKISEEDLLRVHRGTRTQEGLRENIRVGVQYIEAWLRGRGAVPLYNLMEDAATAEISRAQIWQQLQHHALLDDGKAVTIALFLDLLRDEMTRLRVALTPALYDAGRFPEAIRLFRELTLADSFESFLTVPAYQLLLRSDQ